LTQKTTSKISYLEQLQQCLDDDYIVEVITATNEVTGQLSVLGKDFLGITSSSERKTSKVSVGQDGTKETQEYFEVFHLETFIKFDEIKAVSRVLNKTIK